MQTTEASKLRKQWGDKPCDHPYLTKEYELGSATGDFICTKCGRSGWGSDWNVKEKGKSNP